MRTNARGFVAFVATGCLAAGAIGWGVWRASTPEEVVTAVDTSPTHSTPTIGKVDASTTMSEPPAVSTTSVIAEVAPAPVEISKNDPLLAPNAYIPPAGQNNRVAPTRVFNPQNPIVSAQAQTSTSSSTPVTPVSSTATTTPVSSTTSSTTPEPTGTPTQAPEQSTSAPAPVIAPIAVTEPAPTTPSTSVAQEPAPAPAPADPAPSSEPQPRGTIDFGSSVPRFPLS